MSFAFLLARQRSGTGALGSVLDKHPELKYVGEVFHPDNVGQDDNYFTFLRKRVAKNADAALASANEANFTAFIDTLKAAFPDRLLVIDIKYRSLHHCEAGWRGLVEAPWLIRHARQAKAPILHLTRKNFVESFVSGRLAEANKVWHARDDKQLKRTTTVVNVRQLSNYIMNTEREVALIQDWTRRHKPCLEFDYSNMMDSTGHLDLKLAGDIAETLDIGAFTDRAPSFVKQAPGKVTDAIENLEIVQQALAGTLHEWMVA